MNGKANQEATTSGSYVFCVDIHGQPLSYARKATYRYGDLDPGKEVARILVLCRYKNQPGVDSVGVNDYSNAICGNAPEDDFTATASWEQLSKLGNAIGKGDLVTTAALAADIVTGGLVSVVASAGDFLRNAQGDLGGPAKEAAKLATDLADALKRALPPMPRLPDLPKPPGLPRLPELPKLRNLPKLPNLPKL